ncbi:UNVERIFIED_CONTAM: hypothetical protein Slati_1735600 [Sesamum latifolium]|uniref:Uncharacterized protein n=1 Tax=Sesamum latifolium TaxID=2727402 RepID=A0AAW2WWD8_9LAMI
MKTPSNTPNKPKAGEAPAAATTQALQVVPSAPLTSLSGMTTTAMPRSTEPAANTPRIIATQDAPPVELSPTHPRNSSADDYIRHPRATDSPRPCPGDNATRSGCH